MTSLKEIIYLDASATTPPYEEVITEIIKIETNSSISNAKDILSSIINKYKQIKDFRVLRINIDVDPI